MIRRGRAGNRMNQKPPRDDVGIRNKLVARRAAAIKRGKYPDSMSGQMFIARTQRGLAQLQASD